MSTGTIDIIAHKRDGRALSTEEIDYMVQGYTIGRIPDYQMAALLMAIYWQGMNTEEIVALTRSMLHSGDTFNLTGVSGIKADKHSTGGVGDKTSLILAPLLAAAGYKIPMISGRGLLHSGGTLDKLESIPGFQTDLAANQVVQQIKNIGLAMVGQTRRIVPADRKIYALRNVIATVASIPLVTSSILSKKLAEDIDILVLDIKYGRGAFFEDKTKAVALAQSLVITASAYGLKTIALLTNMNQPIGFAIGNWLEIKESLQCLKGTGPGDLMELTYALAAQIVRTSRGQELAEIYHHFDTLIKSGLVYDKFLQMVQSQGGDISYIQNPEKYRQSKYQAEISAEKDGFIQSLDALEFGKAIVRLGGGRQVIEDSIDYCAGIWLDHKVGDAIYKGDRLATIYTDRELILEQEKTWLQSCITIGPQLPVIEPLVWKIMDESGEREWANDWSQD